MSAESVGKASEASRRNSSSWSYKDGQLWKQLAESQSSALKNVHVPGSGSGMSVGGVGSTAFSAVGAGMVEKR
jgi:hypothetical protein